MHLATKQTSEIRPYGIDFARRLPTGETIDSLEVLVYDKLGVDVTSSLLANSSISGAIGIGVIQAGEDGETYNIAYLATTTPSGFVFVDNIFLTVQDKTYTHA